MSFSVFDAAIRGFNRDLPHTHTYECVQRVTAGINTHTHTDKRPQTDAPMPQIYARTLLQLSSVFGISRLAVQSRNVCLGGRLV